MRWMSGEVQGPGRRRNLGALPGFCREGFGPLTKIGNHGRAGESNTHGWDILEKKPS